MSDTSEYSVETPSCLRAFQAYKFITRKIHYNHINSLHHVTAHILYFLYFEIMYKVNVKSHDRIFGSYFADWFKFLLKRSDELEFENNIQTTTTQTNKKKKTQKNIWDNSWDCAYVVTHPRSPLLFRHFHPRRWCLIMKPFVLRYRKHRKRSVWSLWGTRWLTETKTFNLWLSVHKCFCYFMERENNWLVFFRLG